MHEYIYCSISNLMGRMIIRIYHADVNHKEYAQSRSLGVKSNSVWTCLGPNDSSLSAAQFQIWWVRMMMKIDDVFRHQGTGHDDAYISQDSGLMLLMFLFLLISSFSSSWDWSRWRTCFLGAVVSDTGLLGQKHSARKNVQLIQVFSLYYNGGTFAREYVFKHIVCLAWS